MKKLCLAALAAITLCTGTAAPLAAQATIQFPWKIEEYNNGYLIYYCDGNTIWTNRDEPPGTLVEVHMGPPCPYPYG
jgi:hypothetical protein